jgi:predicted kinase
MCGLPGAGKTTLARRLAQAMATLRLCPDEWLIQLGFDLFDEAARDRIEALQWDLAQELLRLGQSVILESGFWLRSDRDEKRLAARALGARVELRYLEVPLDDLWRRIETRNAEAGWREKPIRREQLEQWTPNFQPPDAAEIQLFDAPEK